MKKLILASLLALVFSGCSIFSNAPTNSQIKQCDAGDASVCVEIASYYYRILRKEEYQVKKLDTDDRQLFRNKAVQFYSKACELKDREACFEAAEFSDDLRKIGEAINYYKKACDLSHTDACYIVARAYKYGNGVKQDLQKAYEYYKEYGRMDSDLADYLEKLPSYEKSCELNEADSCLKAAEIHKKSYFIAKNETNARLRYEKAAALLEQSCRRGDNVACLRVSGIYTSVMMMQDVSKATTMLELACKRDYSGACFLSGIIYYRINSNYPKAAEFFEKACKNGHSEACYHLGICYNEGKGVQTNLSKAKQYYHKACNVGIEEACKKLMVITNMGIQ